MHIPDLNTTFSAISALPVQGPFGLPDLTGLIRKDEISLAVSPNSAYPFTGAKYEPVLKHQHISPQCLSAPYCASNGSSWVEAMIDKKYTVIKAPSSIRLGVLLPRFLVDMHFRGIPVYETNMGDFSKVYNLDSLRFKLREDNKTEPTGVVTLKNPLNGESCNLICSPVIVGTYKPPMAIKYEFVFFRGYNDSLASLRNLLVIAARPFVCAVEHIEDHQKWKGLN